MASIFGHAAVGYTLYRISNSKNAKLFVCFAILSAILPDADVIGFKLGIPYEAPLGHRGFTHSILFAFLWSLLLTWTVGNRQKPLWFLVVFFSTVSHGILDALTNGGRGVGFLIPFNNDRFFFPWRRIVVSPIHVEDFFTEWGMAVIISEIKFIYIPCFFIFVYHYLMKLNKF